MAKDEEAAVVEQAEEIGGAPQYGSWEWFENAPGIEEVVERLKTLPEVWGIRPEDFVEYIQPLSQSKNVAVEKGVKDYKTVWNLYVTVAGRLAMVTQAAIKNGWRVEFVPEPVTPTGVPGMLAFGERIVYREYVEIWIPLVGVRNEGTASEVKTNEWAPLGRKPGTAWVPGEGGSGAVASNRFEKVETSARGRAIAAWGFGVLPGSGIASLDEMLSLGDLRKAGEQEGRRRGGRTQEPKKPRPELESDLRLVLADYQMTTKVDDAAMDEKVQAYCRRSFNKELPKTPEGAWDFVSLKDGELVMLVTAMKQGLARWRAETDQI